MLLELAEAAGLERAPLEARWADAGEVRRVVQLEESVKELGIRGVPTFILNRKLGVSGAQALAAAIREATTS